MIGLGECGHAENAVTATLARAGGMDEVLGKLGFTYQFRLLSPDDANRARFIRLRDLLDGSLADDQRIVLRAELDDIPLHEVWTDITHNLVPTVGKNHLLDSWLAGSTYTAAWYMGLTATGASYNAADTMSSHSGWTESTAYSNANRLTCAFSSAASGSKALSSALAFNINGTATIAGAFIASVNTKGGTTGTLGSASNFTGGDRAVANGDTLSVSGSWAV